MKYRIFFNLFFLISFISCTKNINTDVVFIVDKDSLINDSYIGNGVQWDPYQLDYGKGRVTMSDDDWKKLYNRLDNMSPQFIRMMIYSTEYIKNGKYDNNYDFEQINKILSYCQSRNITVMIGDWGGNMVYPNTNQIDTFMLSSAAKYARFLIKEKGFNCIKYYNMINEPNGSWSSNQGNYNLWARAIKYFQTKMSENGLSDILGLAGPDAAIWDESESWWVDSCAYKFNNGIKLYDIHTYPTKSTVNSGEYSKIIRRYKEKVPDGSKIIMGEIGLKFFGQDSLLDKENKQRALGAKFASLKDSQMFVYDHSYGTDMADALFQAMTEGFSGVLIWMLDDAMHANYEEGPDKLKIWGFWNILGEEYFGGANEELVRPFYYSWSLLSKYIPKGSSVLSVKMNKFLGVRVIVVEHNGKFTVGVVNTSSNTKNILLKSNNMPLLKDVRQYNYIENEIIKDGDCIQLPNADKLDLDLSEGVSINIPSNAMIIYTNM